MSIEITNWIMNGIAGDDMTVVELCLLETTKRDDGTGKQDVYAFTVTGKHATTAYITEHLQELLDAHKQEQAIAELAPEAQLKALRDAVAKAIKLADIPDKVAIGAVALFPVWAEGAEYKVGERLSYQGTLYKVLKDHTSRKGWEPTHASTLFAIVTEAQTYPEWKRPTGDGYKKGDKVTHNGKNWVSTYSDNRWEPGSLGWDELK